MAGALYHQPCTCILVLDMSPSACTAIGELPSFQAESEHMSELLQAHRVNLTAAQSLR